MGWVESEAGEEGTLWDVKVHVELHRVVRPVKVHPQQTHNISTRYRLITVKS